MNNSRSSSKATAEDNRLTLESWREANREDDRLTGKGVKHIQRWLMMDGLTKSVGVQPLTSRQRRIVALVFTEGVKQLRYKSMGRNTSLIAWIALRTGIHRNHVGKAIRELEARAFVARVVENGEQWMWLTSGIFEESAEVQRRCQLRSYVGEGWREVERYGVERAMSRVRELMEADYRRSDKARRDVFDIVLDEVLDANYPTAEGLHNNMRHLWRHKARKAR